MRRRASLCASAGAIAVAIALAVASGAARAAGPALAQLATQARVSPIASQRIYFVLPDRYRNGDASNDRGGLSGPVQTTGFDPASPGAFHGGDFKGLTGDCTGPDGLARLRNLGFTAVWVTPPVKNAPFQNGSAGYHGYWGLDFTTVDPHLGTESDFAAFVGCAHRLGLKVYMDVVVNHTADVIHVPSAYSIAPYRDCHGARFDPADFARGSTFPCLDAKSFPHAPVVPAAESHAKKPDWLNDPTAYHNRGDIDFASCSEECYEQGDFYGLDDLFTEQPRVADGLAAIYTGWIRRYQLDGFRLDTARHVNAAFFGRWAPKILAAARAAGVKGFQLFGEVPVTDDVELSAFVRDRGLSNVLDFPLQARLADFAAGVGSAEGIAARLDDDDYFRTADGVDPAPPTFLGNHDLGRAAFQLQTRGGAHGRALLRRVLFGYDLLYLLRGAPVVYYGDEVGMIGRGGDQQARQDMFPTAVGEWKTQERVGSPAIGSGSSFDVKSPIEERLRALGKLRDEVPALSGGSSVVRLARGGLLAVSRIDATTRREVLALFNAGTGAARLTVRTATPSAAWHALWGSDVGVRSDANGTLTLRVPPLSAVLLRAQREPRRSGAPVLKAGPDDLSALFRLRATVPGGPASVTFALRRGTGPWQRIAVDDGAPYRAFLEPLHFRRGEKVQVVAVARSLADGGVTVSNVLAATPRTS
jgi:glycosidase